jgi:hypothetical protein
VFLPIVLLACLALPTGRTGGPRGPLLLGLHHFYHLSDLSGPSRDPAFVSERGRVHGGSSLLKEGDAGS